VQAEARHDLAQTRLWVGGLLPPQQTPASLNGDPLRPVMFGPAQRCLAQLSSQPLFSLTSPGEVASAITTRRPEEVTHPPVELQCVVGVHTPPLPDEPEPEGPGAVPDEPEPEEPGAVPDEPEPEEPGFVPDEPEPEEPDDPLPELQCVDGVHAAPLPDDPEPDEPGFVPDEPEPEEPGAVPDEPEPEEPDDPLAELQCVDGVHAPPLPDDPEPDEPGFVPDEPEPAEPGFVPDETEPEEPGAVPDEPELPAWGCFSTPPGSAPSTGGSWSIGGSPIGGFSTLGNLAPGGNCTAGGSCPDGAGPSTWAGLAGGATRAGARAGGDGLTALGEPLDETFGAGPLLPPDTVVEPELDWPPPLTSGAEF
jgi:hypothetical protein